MGLFPGVTEPRSRPDEQLNAWLARAAHRYGVHPRALLEECGVRITPQAQARLPELLLGEPGERVATALGMQPLHLVEFRSPVATALAGTRTRYRSEFLKASPRRTSAGSRWCPLCLSDDGVWRDSWTDPWHLDCAVHGVRLGDRCAGCYTKPFAEPAWLTSTDEPHLCPSFVTGTDSYGRYRHGCHVDLRTMPTGPAPTGGLEAQAYLFDLALLAHAEPTSLVLACGVEGEAETVIEAAFEMAGALTAGRLGKDFEGDAELERYARNVAATVLRQPDAAHAYALAIKHGALGGDDELIPMGPRASVRARPRNPLLTAVRLRDLHERVSLGYELRFRLGSERPRYPDDWNTSDRTLQEIDRRPALPMAWIPQQIWSGALAFDAPDDFGIDSPTGRTFASIALARYGTTRPWAVIATNLGLPAHSAPAYHRHWKRIHDSGRWPEYLRAVDGLFNRLHEEPPPIDYERRRLACGDGLGLRAIAQKVLAELPEGRGPETAIAVARVFWAKYTGGCLTMAHPPLRSERPGRHSGTTTPQVC
ncbi:TniQ family protein [Cellulomonas sp. Sa3CUA2]|uniref:TniQ family protein n=1 Tax=Cellulomonas avistercoris TaxID=2762242 RepID=A0ABR8QHN0_9CELL|nr:TniQ family protein [Cellulomonas avistercoris]MBD7919905.1 TniQ family protein [Cellulomonas avistercoris]